MRFSIVSFLSGCLALIIVAVLGYAQMNDDGVTGWLTSQIGKVISLFPQGEPSEKGFSAIGAFNIYEDNLRRLLIVGSIIFAVIGLVFAYISAKKEQFSLWYSAGVLLAGTALSILHLGLGIVAMLVTTILILSVRKGMPRA